MGSNEKDGGRVEAIEDQQSLESNEIEKSKVGIMRALVEREDPSSKVGIGFSFVFLFDLLFFC
jgi:hypothetical protein